MLAPNTPKMVIFDIATHRWKIITIRHPINQSIDCEWHYHRQYDIEFLCPVPTRRHDHYQAISQRGRHDGSREKPHRSLFPQSKILGRCKPRRKPRGRRQRCPGRWSELVQVNGRRSSRLSHARWFDVHARETKRTSICVFHSSERVSSHRH